MVHGQPINVILNVAVRHLSAVFDVLHRGECECCMVGLTDYEASKWR